MMDTLIFVCRSAYFWALGCEDYKHVVINARHELILIQARNDNCLVGDSATEALELFKIQ